MYFDWLLSCSGSGWTGDRHQEPATQSADITDSDTAGFGGDDGAFGGFDEFDDGAASGVLE